MKVLLLVPQGARKEVIMEHYIKLLLPKTEYQVMFLYDPRTRISMTERRRLVSEEYQEAINEADYTVICHADWFQAVYKNCKPMRTIGYRLQDPKGNFIFFAPNPHALTYDPSMEVKIAQALSAVNDCLLGSYQEPGKDIIRTAQYAKTPSEISSTLAQLMSYDVLTCDIETRNHNPDNPDGCLCHVSAGVVSVAFAWNEHEGVVLYINEVPENLATLKQFFENWQGKLIFHNIAYDVYILIYRLFMQNPLDQAGLLNGLHVFLDRDWDDTKLITYLATNSAAGNSLGLKDNTQEYSGDYAVDEIKDIDKIPVDKMMKYNLIDTLSTWYLYKKYHDKMVNDQQEQVYDLFRKATKDIIQMQLTGMPLDMNQVKKAKAQLQKINDDAIATIKQLSIVKQFEAQLKLDWVARKNATLKTKTVSLLDANRPENEFNVGSGQQTAKLLYEQLKLPVLATTANKQPKTDGDTFTSLLAHVQSGTEEETLLKNLIAYKEVSKILQAFIPHFEAAYPYGGWHWLYGHFNLGGTVSGRLSSSKPNLQNLPATGSKYAHVIKECFKAPPGWLMIGIDFASLEDRISALTTKDPQKLKVYTDGYDGHCLRSFFYLGDQMPDIQQEYAQCKTEAEKVKVINSIKKRYKHLRQESKGYTFALTYNCIAKTLETKFGASKEKAEKIYKAFHELYHVSDEWVKSKIQKAFTDGYVECAFGLRLRTPKMFRSFPEDIQKNFAVGEEFRTAANALGQSYGLLNSRSGVEFNEKVRASKYRLDIKPICQIHDAQYFLIKDDPDVFIFCNEGLVQADSWQELPEIKHPDVHLGGELSVFYPSWADEFGVPNHVSKQDLLQLTDKYLTSL